jgi:hypothetical protein
MGKYLALQRVRAYFGLKEILEEKRMSSYLIQKFLHFSSKIPSIQMSPMCAHTPTLKPYQRIYKKKLIKNISG